MADNWSRRLRGAAGNALVWGASWAAVGFVVFSILRLTGGVKSDSWIDGVGLAIKCGVIGTIAGGAFSAVIGLFYHGRRLSDISWVRFGIGGAVVSAVFVPLFLQTMNILSGDGMVPWHLVLDDIPISAVLGGVAAAFSMKLAQRADRALRAGDADEPEQLESGSPMTSAADREIEPRKRTF